MACGRGEGAQLCNDTVCWEHDGSWLETVAATPVKLWMDADLQARFDEASVHKTFGQASQLQVGDNLFSLHKIHKISWSIRL